MDSADTTCDHIGVAVLQLVIEALRLGVAQSMLVTDASGRTVEITVAPVPPEAH